MRKNKLTFCFILLAFVVKTQSAFSWFPFRPNTQYNYKVDSAAAPITSVIKIDSLNSNSPVNYHLNKIVANCDTCINSHLANDYFDSTYVLNGQPQFAGHYFYKTNSGGFYFKGSRSFLLLPFNPVGTSWIYDTAAAISATLASKSVQSLLGNSDSVCIFKLSSSDTIILSKNWGIIKFPFSATHNYHLTGVEGATTAGLKLQRFHDFFDFNAGDVFQYSFSDEDFNILPPILKYGHERWDVLSATIFQDSVHYKVRQTYYDSLKIGNSLPTITAYTHTLNLTFLDSAQHPANLYPSQEMRADPYFLYYNGLKYIHKMILGVDNNSRQTKSFGENCPNFYLSTGHNGAAIETSFNHVFLNKNSQKVVGRQLTEGLGVTSELYNDYARVYQRCLIGYIKGADTTGTIYESNPLSIKAYSYENSLYSVYPVPANETLTVFGLLKQGLHLKILNSFGESLLEETIIHPTSTYRLNLSQFSEGIYFLWINFQNQRFVRKVVVSR